MRPPRRNACFGRAAARHGIVTGRQRLVCRTIRAACHLHEVSWPSGTQLADSASEPRFTPCTVTVSAAVLRRKRTFCRPRGFLSVSTPAPSRFGGRWPVAGSQQISDFAESLAYGAAGRVDHKVSRIVGFSTHAEGPFGRNPQVRPSPGKRMANLGQPNTPTHPPPGGLWERAAATGLASQLGWLLGTDVGFS